MLTLDFPSAGLYTPHYFCSLAPTATADCEELTFSIVRTDTPGGITFTLYGTPQAGGTWLYSLRELTGFDYTLRDFVGNTDGYVCYVFFTVTNAATAEVVTRDYKFVGAKHGVADFPAYCNDQLQLSAAAGRTKRLATDHAFGTLLSFHVATQSAAAYGFDAVLQFFSNDGAHVKTVVLPLSATVKNAALACCRLLAADVQEATPAGYSLARATLRFSGHEESYNVQPAGEVPVAVVSFRNVFYLDELFYFFGGWEEERKVTRSEATTWRGAEVYDADETQEVTLRTGPLHEAEQLLFEDMATSLSVTLHCLGHESVEQEFAVVAHELKRSADPTALPEGKLKLRPLYGQRLAPLPPAHPATFDTTFDAPFD